MRILGLKPLAALLLALTAACPDNGPSGPVTLSMPETELLGLWSRYRSSNARTEYILFKSNKSACYFEIGNSNWSKLVYKVWPTWNVIEENPVGAAYQVVVPASGLTYTFDYGTTQLYPTGFSSVIYTPDGGTNAALNCSP